MISGMTGNVFAAMQRGQGGGGQDNGSARLQQMMRKLALERDRLRTEKAVMSKELDALNKDHKKLKSKQKKTKAKLTRAEKLNGKYKERVNLYGEKLRALIPRLRNTLITLGQAKTTINDQSNELLTCMNYNIKLFDAGTDMLGKYEEKGVWDALAQLEPLTQLKQVEIENVIEDYRYKMLDLQVLSKAEDVTKVNNIAVKVISSATSNGQKTLAETEKVDLGNSTVADSNVNSSVDSKKTTGLIMTQKTRKITTLNEISGVTKESSITESSKENSDTVSNSTQNAGLSESEINYSNDLVKNRVDTQ